MNSVDKCENNLAKILAEKASKRIYQTIDEICSGFISDDKLEKITEMITLTAADVNKKRAGIITYIKQVYHLQAVL